MRRPRTGPPRPPARRRPGPGPLRAAVPGVRGRPRGAPCARDGRPDPRNVYAATKLHQEHLCAAYAREHGAIAVALRYHNVYGPRMPRDTPYAGVASIVRSAVERGEAADGVRGRRAAA